MLRIISGTQSQDKVQTKRNDNYQMPVNVFLRPLRIFSLKNFEYNLNIMPSVMGLEVGPTLLLSAVTAWRMVRWPLGIEVRREYVE